MTLEAKITEALKQAMKEKDEAGLRALRAIKSAILLEKTSGSGTDGLTEEQELKLLQKLAKQRRESLDIYKKQDRPDLAAGEEQELAVLEKFLPAQMSEEEVRTVVARLIAENGLQGSASAGKLMPLAMKELAGKADGRMISTIAKELLG